MNAKEKQRLKILLVLLAALGVTIVFVYQMNRPQTAAAIEPPQTRITRQPPAPNDARIRIDLIEKGARGESAGDENVFQYRMGRPASPPPGAPIAPPPTLVTQPPPSVVTPPAGPPPPPPIPLKYQGYAQAQTGLTAFLSDDTSGTPRHFNATAGEVLMGRYRVVRVTESSVEIEDLEYNRRQVLPLLK